jgi:serine/threonine protein phosphatase 1
MKTLLQTLTNPIRMRSAEPGEAGRIATPDTAMVVLDENGRRRSPALADGTRIYVIGDVHGQIECLRAAIARIVADRKARPARTILTVFIGDYIDRGLASRAVIDRIMAEDEIGTKITLRGNHEAMMLRALDDPAHMKAWCDIGGTQTLFSYGVDVRQVMVGRGYAAAQADLQAALPATHLSWLQGLLPHYQKDDYLFCHAGIDPDRPLHDQIEDDLLWIRDKFTRDDRVYPKIVVHGHSPVDRIDIRHNRINVDTGAAWTWHLGCLALEGDGAVAI